MTDTDDLLTRIDKLLDLKLEPFRDEMRSGFREVTSQFEGLYQRDETREHEYLSMREQIRRLEERIRSLEQTVSV